MRLLNFIAKNPSYGCALCMEKSEMTSLWTESHSIDTPEIQTNIELDSIKYDFDSVGGVEATDRPRSNNGCIGRSLCCVLLNLNVNVYTMERATTTMNETKKKSLHKSHYSKMFHREIS